MQQVQPTNEGEQLRAPTLARIKGAFENAGVEFIPATGVGVGTRR